MGEYFDQIPDNIQGHIRDITKTSGLDDNEESLEKMSQAWIEKKSVFEDKIASMSMEELDSFEKDDERGVLILTYSGSLLIASPIDNDARNIVYTSIGVRADVPNSAGGGNAKIADDLEVDKEIIFESGPIKSTSAVFKIAVCSGDVSSEDQEETLKNATEVIGEEFTKINKTIILE